MCAFSRVLFLRTPRGIEARLVGATEHAENLSFYLHAENIFKEKAEKA
jgi:hypothetical protein